MIYKDETSLRWIDKTGKKWRTHEMEFNHLKNTINYTIKCIDNMQKIMITVNRALALGKKYKVSSTHNGKKKYHGSLEDFRKEIQKSIRYHTLFKKKMETEFIARIMEEKSCLK